MKHPDKPTIPEVLPLVRALYARHAAGCCLHILLDDGNIDQDDAEFCLQYARKEGHAECEHLAALLCRMSWSQRNRLSRAR